MAEPTQYPGSPSVSPEVREKVLQTFRHTLEMARTGRIDDALLGCDFILKMDARFAPAKKLLEALRGVASGTSIDLAAFGAFLPGAAAAAPRPAPPSPPPAAPSAPTAFGPDPFGFPPLEQPTPFASAPSPAPQAPPSA